MLGQVAGRAPERWQELAALALAPLLWIPRLQSLLIDFLFHSSSGWTAAAKYVLLACPTLLVLVALWCTQLSLYTLLFRSRRVDFVSMLLVTWWDAVCAAWLYWVRLLRAVTVLVGWLVTVAGLALKLLFEAVRQLVLHPASVVGRMTTRYFGPGVAWVALMLLAFWCALEATVFTYILLPTVSEVLEDFVGVDRLPRPAATILWSLLFLLVMGSFVCVQVLIEAIHHRRFKLIVPIILVELFVMYFEVAFLYREVAEAAMPWIVQESGDTIRPGLWFTLTVARFGWMGTRGTAWFLFGQYGTPPLLAVIARRPMIGSTQPPLVASPGPTWWRGLREDVTRRDWLHGKGHDLVQYLRLPLLHLVAAALNFAMVLVTAQPLFSLPLDGLEEPRRLQ